MSDFLAISGGSGDSKKTSEGYEAIASLNDGFLGTGYTTSVELSFIAMALIVGYVAYSTTRYFMPELRIRATVAEMLGLR